MSKEEHAQLSALLEEIAPAHSRERTVQTLILNWGGLMGCFLIFWWLVAALLHAVFGLNVGWRSKTSTWIFPIGAILSFAGVLPILRVGRRLGRKRKLLESDLRQGEALVETYRFMETIRFQEPEHGGLIYFLRTAEGEVFVEYDIESQDLGVAGKDPMQSRFRPRCCLTLVRAPQSGYVMTKAFEGEVLSLGKPFDMLAPPAAWPESEELCSVRWSDLVVRYGSAR